MPLFDMDLLIDQTTAPGDVRSFLREADRPIERFRLDYRVPGFVPSDYSQA